MKKHLLIVTFSLLGTYSFGQANVYHPFPDSNAIWHELFMHLDGTTNNWVDDWHYHDISGDTTIGNFTYHKLYKFGTTSDYLPYPQPSLSSSEFYRTYCGAFRQDTANKRIYMYDHIWDHKDTLAYDFNLNLGDTLPLTYLFGYNYVTSIDSFPVGDHYNKRFWLRDIIMGRTFELIEGIGSSSGGFEFLGEYFECGFELLCMKVDNETIYPNDSTYNCIVINQTPEINNQIEISISPNPFSLNTIININHNLRNAILEIYDIYGRMVKTEKNISGQRIEIHRENLPNGFYFIRLSQGNKVISTQKVIISN